MDIDLGGILPPGSQGEMVPPLASPRRTDHVPQSPVRQHSSTSQAATASSQGSNESALVSLLSQRSTKDSKQMRRPSNNDQEMPSTKVTHMKSCLFTISHIYRVCKKNLNSSLPLKQEGLEICLYWTSLGLLF